VSNSPKNELKATECLKSLNDTLKHLNEINSYSQVNQERQVRFLSMRTAVHPDPEETATFPVQMLPQDRNELFFGREAELAAINAKLGTDEISSLQTYTIYGRRGVGKTQVALEYAYRNLGNFDAIFWIQCETSASLRQSITDAANELNLPGASQSGHFEENLVSTHNWLKRTSKRWLLVFDNAEDERLLKGYWPIGARGSILITSRKYYNFIKDIDRGGKTVPLFDNAHSLELLLKFLGTDWQDIHLVETFRESDLAAARSLVKMIGGLALAIEQAASLILSLGTHLRGFLDIFVKTLESLPDRPLGKRDSMIKSLDTIFSIAFQDLSTNARTLLGVLAFLAPDGIQLDLFLPRNQRILQGRLEFCMTSPTGQEDSHAALSNVIDPPPGLQKVIDELLEAKLIRFDNRIFSIHRVIQEALNFRDFAELQDSFDAAVCLLFEAFPKQESGDPLHTVWATCQDYVQHVVQLFKKFNELRNPEATITLAARRELILLGANCGW
jgi:NB-ARC domain